MLNKTMLIWGLQRNWVTWFLCSVNLKMLWWPTALMAWGFLLLLFPRQCVHVFISSSPVTLSCSKVRKVAHTHTLIYSHKLSKKKGASVPTPSIHLSACCHRKRQINELGYSFNYFNVAGTKQHTNILLSTAVNAVKLNPFFSRFKKFSGDYMTQAYNMKHSNSLNHLQKT